MAKAVRQTARQWIVTHEWMVNPMQQTEWIEGQGLLIWLAEVFSSLGTGLYIVSLFASSWSPKLAWWGALVGWIIVVGLKLPLHFLYLGRPWRFWRAGTRSGPAITFVSASPSAAMSAESARGRRRM